MAVRRSEVIVTLAWGDVIVRVARWIPRPFGAFVLPAPFGDGRAGPLLYLDDRGEVVVDCGRERRVALPRGGRVVVALEHDVEAGAYRTPCGASLVAIIEQLDTPARASLRAIGVRAASLLSPMLLFAALVAIAYGSPGRARPDFASATGVPVVSATEVDTHRSRLPFAATILLDDTRPVEPDDVACGWGCGWGKQEAESPIGLRPRGSCLAVLRVHVVEAGETLTSIARDYGFDGYRRLYDARVNPELVKERRDPDRIYVGDVVVIPNVRGDAEIACVSS